MSSKRVQQTPSPPSTDAENAPVKQDGRKRRWHDHKIARRNELVDGTINAIRTRGHDIGMDEIASEIGVSKTVLYRYFADKNDLTTATMMRYVEQILAPRIYAAVAEDLDEYELARVAISTYVETVGEDPNIYLYVMSNGSSASRDVVADSERMIAELVATVLGERLRVMEMDSGGSIPWAYGIVGGIQLATHWWISNQSMTAEDLIDYLTMMVWGGMKGIASAGGSPAKFRAQPHSLTEDSDE